MQAADSNAQQQKQDAQSVSIEVGKPLTFWVGVLVIALIVEIIAVPVLSAGYPSLTAALGSIAGYVIYLPGAIILPLVTSLWIGDKVGMAKGKRSAVLRTAIVNALYTVLVYAVAIFIVYLLLIYSGSPFIKDISIGTAIIYLLGLPVIIAMALIPLFSMLSSERRRG